MEVLDIYNEKSLKKYIPHSSKGPGHPVHMLEIEVQILGGDNFFYLMNSKKLKKEIYLNLFQQEKTII